MNKSKQWIDWQCLSLCVWVCCCSEFNFTEAAAAAAKLRSEWESLALTGICDMSRRLYRIRCRSLDVSRRKNNALFLINYKNFPKYCFLCQFAPNTPLSPCLIPSRKIDRNLGCFQYKRSFFEPFIMLLCDPFLIFFHIGIGMWTSICWVVRNVGSWSSQPK